MKEVLSNEQVRAEVLKRTVKAGEELETRDWIVYRRPTSLLFDVYQKTRHGDRAMVIALASAEEAIKEIDRIQEWRRRNPDA